MTQLAIAFALMLASVLQVLLPTTVWTGWAPAPIMAGLVIYFALMRPRALALEVALLAGLIEDSLGQMPLGYTSFCYAVAALVVEHFRETVIVRQWTTHVMFGALVSLGVTAFTFALLAKDGLIAPGLGHVLLRLAGAFLLGGVAAPLAFAGMETLDRTLGNIELGESG
jgi:rod shape-determining protein MreD